MCLGVNDLGPYILIFVAHLVHMGVGHTVGTDESVAIEVVVGGIVVVVVAAIGVDGAPLSVLSVQCLVDKVPDESALELGIAAHEVPILLESATRVAHGMVVLTLDEWFLVLGLVALGIILAPLLRGIHRAHDVGIGAFVCLLPVHRPAQVLRLDPLVGGGEVGTVDRLVAHRPDDHTGVVEVDAHIMLVALQDLQSELWLLGLGVVSVAKSMRLLVGLGAEVDAILVAEVIPHGVVGIVAGAHGIDVELLHDLDVLYHALPRHHVATVGVHLMAVGTLDVDGLSVDEELRVAYLHLSEAHPHGDSLIGCETGVGRGGAHHQRIEIRCLGRPLPWVFHVERHLCAVALEVLHPLLEHGISLGVKQLEGEVALARERHVDLQRAVGIGGVEVGSHPDIVDMHGLVAGEEIAVAGHPREAPEILVLTVGAVAPAESLEGDEIVALAQVWGDVELCRHLAVLGVSHKLSVHPQVHVGGDGAEMGHHLLALPVVGDIHHAPVTAHPVVFHRHLGRVVLEVSSPCESDVHVDGVAETIEFPHSRHGHASPSPVVEVLGKEVGGPLVGVLHTKEFPHTLERQVVARGFHVARHGLFGVAIGEEGGVDGEPVDVVHLHVVPFGESGHVVGQGSLCESQGQQSCQKYFSHSRNRCMLMFYFATSLCRANLEKKNQNV